MKKILKSALNKTGYDIVQYIEMPQCPFDVLDLVINSRLSEIKSGSVVQVGANDGVRNDPIHHLILKYQLSGLLVEPIPDLFARLQANYSDYPNVQFECCAIGDADGELTIYRVQPNDVLPDWTQGLASFNKQHLSSAKFGVPNLEKYVEPLPVPVLTMKSLIQKHRISKISLLQVDTEGFDCQIVMGALNSGLRPIVINYEYIHATPQERLACKERMASLGYKFIDVGRDTLAVLNAESAAQV
jgi:FkbM family methyltransferase